MKIGFFGESPADQAALAVFTEGILDERHEPIQNIILEGHGWSSVLATLDGVVKGLYYNSDAEALVAALDSDDTQLHNTPVCSGDDCRLCEARKIVPRAKRTLTPIPGKPELKLAIGLTVPTIEAWYLVEKEHQIGEAFYRVGLKEGKTHLIKRQYRSQLKKSVYGTNHPSIELETEIAMRESRRIVQNMTNIETAFPSGFGLMAKEIRSWKLPIARLLPSPHED